MVKQKSSSSSSLFKSSTLTGQRSPSGAMALITDGVWCSRCRGTCGSRSNHGSTRWLPPPGPSPFSTAPWRAAQSIPDMSRDQLHAALICAGSRTANQSHNCSLKGASAPPSISPSFHLVRDRYEIQTRVWWSRQLAGTNQLRRWRDNKRGRLERSQSGRMMGIRMLLMGSSSSSFCCSTSPLRPPHQQQKQVLTRSAARTSARAASYANVTYMKLLHASYRVSMLMLPTELTMSCKNPTSFLLPHQGGTRCTSEGVSIHLSKRREFSLTIMLRAWQRDTSISQRELRLSIKMSTNVLK